MFDPLTATLNIWIDWLARLVSRDRGPLCGASASLVLIHVQLDKVVDARFDPLIVYRDLG
jgi:hypothetical protein